MALSEDSRRFKAGPAYVGCGYCGAEAMGEGVSYATLEHGEGCPGLLPHEPSAVVTHVDAEAGTVTLGAPTPADSLQDAFAPKRSELFDPKEYARSRCVNCHGSGYMRRAQGRNLENQLVWKEVVCDCVHRRMQRKLRSHWP